MPVPQQSQPQQGQTISGNQQQNQTGTQKRNNQAGHGARPLAWYAPLSTDRGELTEKGGYRPKMDGYSGSYKEFIR